MSQTFHRHRQGLSLVELLAVISILAVLASILIVGVQAARDAARRTTCLQNASQIGKAALNYESGSGNLPTEFWQRELFPFLEIGTLPQTSDVPLNPASYAVLHCPADGANFVANAGPPSSEVVYGNYLLCNGTWLDENGQGTGIVQMMHGDSTEGLRFADIRDGSSNTALASEALTGGKEQLSGRDARLRTLWNTPGPPYELPTEREKFMDACRSIPALPLQAGWRGSHYGKGSMLRREGTFLGTTSGVGVNLYNHILPPQSPSCLNGTQYITAIASASSYHRVVSTVFCDGHTESIAPNIDPQIWSEMGTRHDGK